MLTGDMHSRDEALESANAVQHASVNLLSRHHGRGGTLINVCTIN